MTVGRVASIRFHEDPAYFREAVNFTAAATGFPSRMIEKDYFCTVLLQHMAAIDAELVFKGATCLAKVHADFYRLSEDIDFVIPTPVDASRTQRSRRARDLKAAVDRFDQELAGFRVTTPMTGANNSTQYIAVLGYSSLLGPKEETIKLEVGLREPLLTPSLQTEVRTLLLDPVNELPLVPRLGGIGRSTTDGGIDSSRIEPLSQRCTYRKMKSTPGNVGELADVFPARLVINHACSLRSRR